MAATAEGAEDLARTYHRDGYLVLRDAIDAGGITGLQRELAGHVDQLATHLASTGTVGDRYEGATFPRRLALLAADAGLDLRKWTADLRVEATHRLVTSPRLVSALVAVLGPEVVFHGDMQVTAKLPGSTRSAFPWHQDTAYYGVEARHLHVVTVWLPLVPTTVDNGCLWVLPGSHRAGLLPFHRPAAGGNVETRTDLAMGGAVPLELDPGDAVLLSNLTLHASQVNRSDHVRWTVDLGFSAAARSSDPPDVVASRRYVWSMLRRFGRVPVTVASPHGPATWDAWRTGRPGVTVAA